MGYTSKAGNTYFNTVRVAEGIIIKEDVGEGYLHSFLNGIRIYSIKDKILLSERYFHNRRYNRSSIRVYVSHMLIDFLKEAANEKNYSFNERQAEKQIEMLLDKAFSEDQRIILQNQVKLYLA